MHSNAEELRLDASRIGIKGESGGGGIAAGVALFTRDKGGPPLAFQHLTFPMIDDRTAVRKDINPFVGEFVWNREHNLFGWLSLLGSVPGSEDVPPYAAAARETELSKLPATYIAVGSLDLFLEENISYAAGLCRAGVPVEFHLYPGAYHGFTLVESARVTKQAERDSRDALRRYLGNADG
jgi:triacylglycerol lipase